MTTVEISDELYVRLSAISADTSAFESADDLVEFALETVATDLEDSGVGDSATEPVAGTRDSTPVAESDDADDAVEERLGDLGYL